MPKYLLLKHYRGGPEPHRPVPPMDQWAPEDVEAHMAFLRHVGELLGSDLGCINLAEASCQLRGTEIPDDLLGTGRRSPLRRRDSSR